MKAVRRARRRKLEEHRAILESLGVGSKREVISTSCCGLCTCVWLHDDDDDDDDKEGGLFDTSQTAQLRDESSEENYRVDPDKLSLGKLLGQGGNGCVFVGSYYGYPVAVKEMLSDVRFSEAEEADLQASLRGATFEERERARDEKFNQEFAREFNNLRKLRHPNIVDMYGTAIIENDVTHSFRRLLVMELCACSMRDMLRDTNAIVPMATALSWARQVAAGLLSVHSHGLIHFDIKPANVLIDMGGRAKVADLGIARQTKLSTPSSLTFHNDLRIGTPSYMAPELLRGDISRISNRVDVYSFAILLWEVLHRDRPHPDWTLPELFREVAGNKMRPAIEPDIPQGFQVLLQRCWHENPDERPTTQQLLAALEALVPDEVPRLVTTHREADPSDAEAFCVWDPEARTFLGDALFHAQQPNGCLFIEFEDGQPPLDNVDGRNIVLVRELEPDVLAPQAERTIVQNVETSLQGDSNTSSKVPAPETSHAKDNASDHGSAPDAMSNDPSHSVAIV
ncbi:Protein kinase, putative [Hondaea fermentalgiana]|uniref:Protein kinase, putative n=1 Tax=Hondaea fermentalgiana TaxID=2315210 RepID=A0A2R5GKB5_9STRA|nr:Protein kinase, putative [Hondaea fermentalgiana]|eukprot:GBG31352.1 Protein kinase, putative [Hondaea fermentalgiana]